MDNKYPMDDYIRRGTLLENFGGVDLTKCRKEGNLSLKEEEQSYKTLFMYEISDLISAAPAENDVVKVVRCRNCIYDDTPECFLCFIEKHTLTWINHDGDFFCGKGMRKEE